MIIAVGIPVLMFLALMVFILKAFLRIPWMILSWLVRLTWQTFSPLFLIPYSLLKLFFGKKQKGLSKVRQSRQNSTSSSTEAVQHIVIERDGEIGVFTKIDKETIARDYIKRRRNQ